jgi:ABC-type cobalamin/Fe3+-siderophores transport system ATPase subunit
MADLNIEINIENIGPHEKINFTGQSSSLKTAIYANNGSGKTFISRLFRLLETSSIEKVNKLLSFTKTHGSLSFNISDGTNEKKLSIDLSKDAEPSIGTPLPFIFHTFNSDYVHENIEALGYRPDGNIDGYILGKVQIDLSKEKQELKLKKEEFEKKDESLKKNIKEQKAELDKREYAIRKNISEYINFTYENIISKNNLGYTENKSFEELKKENTTLNTLPDDLPDIGTNTYNIDVDFFESMQDMLGTTFSKSYFAEEFKTKVKSKQSFIREGLKLLSNEKTNCPFCEQHLGNDALSLIDQYAKYLEDEEAKTISKIDNFMKNIDTLEEQLDKNYTKMFQTKDEFEKLKKYLPSFKDKDLSKLKNLHELKSPFSKIKTILSEKKDDITKSFKITTQLKEIIEHIDENKKIVESNNKIIESINDRKNNLNKEKLEIKKRLCKAKYLETLKNESSLIDETKLLEDAIAKLEESISQKESQSKTAKRDKVIETFQNLLNVFFSGKYTFDKDNFCLKINTHNLIDNASDVLSDGEKNIISFCFFLAETHKRVFKEDDYKKLFFIIDDPISSLDFHYVYSVAQIIRRLNEQFPIGARLRYLILTHNIEFMSILIRNKIIDGYFILEDSTISKLQKELIMPYEEHLRDLWKISEGTKKPNHTTPNSIRHILETINKFEKPHLDFKGYCEDIGLLEGDNEFLYALVHDNSHGNYRTQRPFTEDMLIKGCKKVISVVEKKFIGQIKVMKR